MLATDSAIAMGSFNAIKLRFAAIKPQSNTIVRISHVG